MNSFNIHTEEFKLTFKERNMHDIFKSQSGAALVIALIMMIALTVIGLASVMSSTFELKLSGNTRGSINAFYTADGGSQAARNADVYDNFSLKVDGSGFIDWADSPNSSLPDHLKTQPIDIIRTAVTKFSFQSASTVTFNKVPATAIYHSTERRKPRATGESALGESYDYEYYITDTVGIDQEGSGWTNPSTARIVEKIALIVPPREGGNP
jgi:hypothetical protein